jgi:hypothetical protein
MRPKLIKISLITLVTFGLVLPNFSLNLNTNQIQAEEETIEEPTTLNDLNYDGIPDQLEEQGNDVIVFDEDFFQTPTNNLSQNNSSHSYRSVYFAHMVEYYNYGAYNDLFLYNAIRWTSFKAADQLIHAVVLDSWGSKYGTGYWNHLANNHPDITISFRDGEIVTSEMLEATNADVLIISDAWNRDYGWEFSDNEIEAIENYISQSHGLIATGGSMDSDAPNNAKLGHLFGNKDTVQPWGYRIIDPWKYPDQRNVEYLHIDDPFHPATNGLPSGYANHHAACIWMQPISSHQVAHFDNYTDSLVTVYESGWEAPPSKWSFAIITDLHIGGIYDPGYLNPLSWQYHSLDYGNPGWNDDDTGKENITTVFLRNAIRLINTNREKYNIAFVVVDGDLTDSAETSELNMVKKILNDELDPKIPWIPLIGNHDIWPYAVDDGEAPSSPPPEKYFDDIFWDQYVKFKQKFPTLEQGPLVVFDPDVWRESYFKNFAFNYKNYHFIGLDFNSRVAAPVAPGTLAEADLHKFKDGTWDWFTKHFEKYINENPSSNENIILLAHHPFNKGTIVSYMGFEDVELMIMEKFLKDYKDNIYAEFAGHTHQNKDYMWWSDIMHIVETDANVESPLVRIVQIDPTHKPGEQVDYSRMLGYGYTVRTTCPVDLEIIDPEDFTINKQFSQIPEAIYIEEDIDGDGSPDDFIGIPERKLGNYQIKVIPEAGATSTDTYTLEVSTLEDSFGYVPVILTEDTPISEIPTEPYIFESKEKETTQLTYTGDLSGQYSDSVSLNATLTDGNGNPLSDKEITFTIGSQSISTTTNQNGVVTASLILEQTPGKYYFVEISFNGDEDYLPVFISQPFEIQKENVVITVIDKEGFYDDNITLEADIRDDDGQLLLQEPKEIEFRLGDQVIGTTTIDEVGKAKIDWKINLIPQELTETYSIFVIFAGNEYYNSAKGQGTFTLKSAKWLKQDAISELEKVKTGDKKTDKKIDKIIWFINQSLDKNLWQDASHLVFFEKGKWKELEGILENDEIDLDKIEEKGPNTGISVFHYEKVAARLMMPKPRFEEEFEISDELEKELEDFKDWKIPDELKSVFEEAIKKLVKADTLLAKVSLYDAKNSPVQNPKFQKIVDKQIERAEKEILKAEKELEKGRPDKTIMRLSKAWLHTQLALKFAILE